MTGIDPNIVLPKTRVEARASGCKYFFTGNPCVRGHVAKRFVSNGWCADCAREDSRLAARKRREKDKDAVNASQREWRAKNPDKVKRWKAAWQQANPEKTKAARDRFLELRPGYEAERSKRRREMETEDDKRAKAEGMATWRKNNLEKSRQSSKRANAKRLSTPKGKLESAIRNAINAEIRAGSKSGRRTFDLLGYTVDQLKEHLERQFLPGMTWENHGEWHIDHKIPLAAHNYKTPDDIDFKKAWNMSNLQPLWAGDNLSKGDKLLKPFQPSLPLSVNDNKPQEVAA